MEMSTNKQQLSPDKSSTPVSSREKNDSTKFKYQDFNSMQVEKTPLLETFEMFYRQSLRHNKTGREQAELYRKFLINRIEELMTIEEKYRNGKLEEGGRKEFQQLIKFLPELDQLNILIYAQEEQIRDQDLILLKQGIITNEDEFDEYDINDYQKYLNNKHNRLHETWKLLWESAMALYREIFRIVSHLEGKDSNLLKSMNNSFVPTMNDLNKALLKQENDIKELEYTAYRLRSKLWCCLHPECTSFYNKVYENDEDLINFKTWKNLIEENTQLKKEITQQRQQRMDLEGKLNHSIKKNVEKEKRLLDIEESQKEEISVHEFWIDQQLNELEEEKNKLKNIIKEQNDELKQQFKTLEDKNYEITNLKKELEERLMEIGTLNVNILEHKHKNKDCKEKSVQTKRMQLEVESQNGVVQKDTNDHPYLLLSTKGNYKIQQNLRDEVDKILLNEEEIIETRLTPLGKIVIKQRSESSLLRLGKLLEENKEIKGKITVEVKPPRGIKIIIFSIPENITEDFITHSLENLFKTPIRLKFIKKSVKKNVYHQTIELDSSSALFLLQKGTINFGLSRCIIRKYVIIQRCYKCQHLFHSASQCEKIAIHHNVNYSETCEYCAGYHNSNKCQNKLKTHKCVNCMDFNKVYNTTYETNHAASSSSCGVFLYFLNQERRNHNFGYFPNVY